jgi:hypothetical protein
MKDPERPGQWQPCPVCRLFTRLNGRCVNYACPDYQPDPKPKDERSK